MILNLISGTSRANFHCFSNCHSNSTLVMTWLQHQIIYVLTHHVCLHVLMSSNCNQFVRSTKFSEYRSSHKMWLLANTDPRQIDRTIPNIYPFNMFISVIPIWNNINATLYNTIIKKIPLCWDSFGKAFFVLHWLCSSGYGWWVEIDNSIE